LRRFTKFLANSLTSIELFSGRVTKWVPKESPSSFPEVWLAQCFCQSNESLPYRKLVESAKAEEQRIRIRTPQGASIDGENLNTLGLRQLFRLS
jgi:hypothetical protein